MSAAEHNVGLCAKPVVLQVGIYNDGWLKHKPHIMEMPWSWVRRRMNMIAKSKVGHVPEPGNPNYDWSTMTTALIEEDLMMCDHYEKDTQECVELLCDWHALNTRLEGTPFRVDIEGAPYVLCFK